MTERVKIYEEKKKTASWMWLLPLLLLLAVLAYVLGRQHHRAPESAAVHFGTVHFDTDQAALTNDGRATLDHAVSSMKSNPNMRLQVQGFTDTTGSASHNDSLSGRRAKTVTDYLASQGIDRSRLSGEGLATEKQVNTNATEQGKADNRRVELLAQQ